MEDMAVSDHGTCAKLDVELKGIPRKLNRLTMLLGHSIERVGNHLEILTLSRGAFKKYHSILSVLRGRGGNFCHS